MVWFKLEHEEDRAVRISIDRSRQEVVAAALRARDAGLVDQAYASMATLVELLHGEDEELTADERQLLSLCVKLFVDQRRSALSAVNEREEQEQDPQEKQVLHQAKMQVQAQLAEAFTTAMDMVETYLLPTSLSSDCRVHALTLKADLCRYAAEEACASTRQNLAMRCQAAYQLAWETALRDLHPLDPLRLSVAVNFSVFLADLVHSPSAAITLAQAAVNAAAKVMDGADSTVRAVAKPIVGLLEENIVSYQALE